MVCKTKLGLYGNTIDYDDSNTAENYLWYRLSGFLQLHANPRLRNENQMIYQYYVLQQT